MANLVRNFLSGKMNKMYDQRVIPNGEYIDAMNIRMGSTEKSEVGVIENTKGNLALTALTYTDGTPLSTDALCIGAIQDSARETIYWFVHDSNFPVGPTGKLDMIVSFNVFTNILTYHVISINDGSGGLTTLNFNPDYLITGVDIIENLLFFTDDYNQPRVINVKRNYANPIAFVDQFSAESLLVIKKPPAQSPSVLPMNTAGQQNFMDTRFICFAYRYRYADGEYSATSQWSEPSFVPQPFDFSINSFLNEGMVNAFNAAQITYNSGGELVVGVDLLFKEANNNIIKIIEKLDKAELGLADNTNYNYVFNNSKIFTILSEAEILRLYDNVPRLAKAQTIMGNRLMYGNYVDGYNLIDANGGPLRLDYYTELVTENIGEVVLPDTQSPGSYTIDGFKVVNNCVLNVDLSGINLVEGGLFSFEITITHDSFTGTVTPTQTTSNITLPFSFYLSQDYVSVYQMATSVEFQNAIGTATNIQPVTGSPNSCDGFTFTDKVNCALPNNLTYPSGSLTKFGSGITANGQAIEITSTPGSDIISFKILAMQYVDNIVTPVDFAYEYYNISFAEAFFQEIASPRSLHSNRGYEIGIVYMDEFNRSSTALVSLNNTEHVPCSNSDTKNSIRVTIPTTQVAPFWAKRYKFVIKPDQEKYETIYSSIFFLSPTSTDVYFLLEGENARKVEQGDRFIVKADSNGPTNSCVYATVLEKEAKPAGFITPVSGVTPPGGVYMKINPNSFSVIYDPNSIIAPGSLTVSTSLDFIGPIMAYPMNLEDPLTPGSYIDYTVPAGSRIKLRLTTQRLGPGSGDRLCEKRIYTLEKDFVASANYSNMQDWWNGDNIGQFVNDGVSDVGAGACAVGNQYFSATLTSPNSIGYDFCTNYWQFSRNPVSNKLELCVRAVQACGSSTSRRSSITLDIQIYRAENVFVFETEPDDALPDVFFENELSFEVNTDGSHEGNVQNQVFATSTPAIIDTGFFNCYAFGNGVESYKIRDSIVGRSFNLGNRVTTVASQDYKEADRFADITYSGVYNPETNLNKLNEFNSGLLNYKNLEISFGEIFVLDGRETDVLVLQEDKISYVLAGKNLLSDSAAGGVITSVPEVLGTQIARTEKYGISFNPESYVQWGYDRYFTDAKRGAVIQLRGDSYSNEQLSVVSEMNMRTWFRDEFNASFSKQKLGGFDPYMNEYVLVFTDRELPTKIQCLNCGISQTFTISGDEDTNYCVDVGPLVGQITVSWNVISIDAGADFNIIVNYNGVDYPSGTSTASGSFTFDKDLNYVETAEVTIEHTGNLVLEVTVSCPVAVSMTIIEVVLTNDSEAGDTVHAEYKYINGVYTSPTQSNMVTFLSGSNTPLVSWYNVVTGFVGSGGFPPDGSTMRIQSNTLTGDTRVFNPSTDRFRYLRSTVFYANNTVGMTALLAASNLASPVVTASPTTYYADFTVPASTPGDFLYLIWDYRTASVTYLCYSDTETAQDACCACTPCEDPSCFRVTITGVADNSTVYFPQGLCGFGGIPFTVDIKVTDPPVDYCITNQQYQILSGEVDIERSDCGCNECELTCDTWYVYDIQGASVDISYTDCTGSLVTTTFNEYSFFCVFTGTIPQITSGVAAIEKVFYCDCCEESTCNTWLFINDSGAPCQIQAKDCGATVVTLTLPAYTSLEYCCDITFHPVVITGLATIKMIECGCKF
jgi:hypothetical protein